LASPAEEFNRKEDSRFERCMLRGTSPCARRVAQFVFQDVRAEVDEDEFRETEDGSLKTGSEHASAISDAEIVFASVHRL
jgi:hypothetical protein